VTVGYTDDEFAVRFRDDLSIPKPGFEVGFAELGVTALAKA
jgi:hypothetical protein